MRTPGFAYDRAAMQARVLARLEAGSTETAMDAEPGWPSRQTLYRWSQEDPLFAGRLAYARMWGRGVRREAALASMQFHEARAEAFLLRVRLGDAVRDLVRRPEGPNREVLNAWKRQRPDFAAALEQAARFAHQQRRLPWPFDQEVADRIIVRVNKGEPLPKVMADPTLPGRAALTRWRAQRPDFALALKAATRGGHRRRMRAASPCTPELTDAIARHIIEGGSLRTASMTPGVPHRVTLYGWMKTRPEFARAIELAKQVRDHRLADMALSVAMGSTPATAVADAALVGGMRKRLGQLRGGRKRADTV